MNHRILQRKGTLGIISLKIIILETEIEVSRAYYVLKSYSAVNQSCIQKQKERYEE